MSTAATSSSTPARASTTSGRSPSLVWPIAGMTAAVILVAALVFFLRSGKGETLPVVYGQRRGEGAAASVNGTSVLAEMFKRAGHRVTTVRKLSPRLEKSDILVWVPNDFEPPNDEQREFLEDWLASGEGRTLIYVGRDYDAASAYWKKIQPLAAAEDADEVQRELAQAQAQYDNQRAKMPKEQYGHWFTMRRDGKRRDVRKLEGPWADGVDASKVDIQIEGRLDIPTAKEASAAGSAAALPDNFEMLLSSNRDALATRITDDDWGDSQVIVITNGSFVLNYPLVNHEHRKLAARLVGECGAAGEVTFIESGPGGPEVSDSDPESAMTNGFELLQVWPLNVILLHLMVLGVVYCIARSPIFGRARELPAETASDFGKHVAALGYLLGRTRDRNYALARVQQYHEQAQRGSGKSHRKPK